VIVRRIVIVGGGASGVLAAIHVLREARAPISLAVVAGDGRPGRGVAYGTLSEAHLLNVPAGRMSALPEDPDHFVRWLERRRPNEGFHARSFAPRAEYGRYLEAVLDEARHAAAGVRFEWIADVAIDAESQEDGVWVRLRGRESGLFAHRLVLAVGPVAAPAGRAADLVDPWSASAFAGLDPRRPVLVLGTGVTMVDLALELWGRGAVSGVWAVSRHGLLPEPHRSTCACRSARAAPGPCSSARGLLRQVRARVRTAQQEGCEWPCVLDALRPTTTELWHALPIEEQRRFLRHLRSRWDVHRHRMPPEIAEAVARLQRGGFLTVRPARVASIERTASGLEVTLAGARGAAPLRLSVQRAFDAMGAYGDASRSFIARLEARGLVKRDRHGLGLAAGFDGSLVGDARGAAGILWTLGPPLRGMCWETTAIPEIRDQAVSLARRLAPAVAAAARSDSTTASL
jgi:uncharacterized NAD(P)/FAD-binding protein YdhS